MKSEFFIDSCFNGAANQSERDVVRGREISVIEKHGMIEGKKINPSYVHGNIPGHVDMGFVFIHPHLSGSQGVAFGIIVYVVVVGLLGALDVGHSGTWQDFHAPSTLPHLNSKKKSWCSITGGFALRPF